MMNAMVAYVGSTKGYLTALGLGIVLGSVLLVVLNGRIKREMAQIRREDDERRRRSRS